MAGRWLGRGSRWQACVVLYAEEWEGGAGDGTFCARRRGPREGWCGRVSVGEEFVVCLGGLRGLGCAGDKRVCGVCGKLQRSACD